MRYNARKSFVLVLGCIWMPNALAATEYPIQDSDIQNMTDDSGIITRESFNLWLDSHSGDFQSIVDFRASISTPDGKDYDFDWLEEDSEVTFNDCMYGEEVQS